jgi:hypothetical protein
MAASAEQSCLDPLDPVISEKKIEMWKANEADDNIKVNKAVRSKEMTISQKDLSSKWANYLYYTFVIQRPISHYT